MPEDKKMITVDEAEYKSLLAKSASQTTKIMQLEAQLKDATEAANVYQNKMAAGEKQEKDALVNEIVRDSEGRLTEEYLQGKDLQFLYDLKDARDRLAPQSFVSVMRQREVDSKKPAANGTIGSYNQDTGKYEGGIEVP